MNEISRIHLARVSYDIDINAKKELEKYLDAVKKSLGKETDAMEDIEIRMTEILAERGVVKDSVITNSDIEAIVEQLGEPKNFAESNNESADENTEEKSTKKYYRDPEHAALGGVIAGLAAYTGWDVTLLRVLAVIFAIIPSWGTLIIVYIVIWIIAPEAKSVSEKMEMRGEPVNLDSIKESAKKFSDKAEVVGKDISAKASKIGKQIEKEAPRIGAGVGRVITMVLGIIGIVICALIICALVIACIWMIPTLINAGASLEYSALFIVTVGLAFGGVFMLVIFGMTLSSMLVDYESKKHSVELLASLIVALVLMTGAVGTGAVWATMAGRDGVEKAVELLKHNVSIDIDNNDEHIRVDVRPFNINIKSE